MAARWTVQRQADRLAKGRLAGLLGSLTGRREGTVSVSASAGGLAPSSCPFTARVGLLG
jgi:hypothetical protein